MKLKLGITIDKISHGDYQTLDIESVTEIKLIYLVTTNFTIHKVTASVNWLFLRCMHIYRESSLMALPKLRYTSADR